MMLGTEGYSRCTSTERRAAAIILLSVAGALNQALAAGRSLSTKSNDLRQRKSGVITWFDASLRVMKWVP